MEVDGGVCPAVPVDVDEVDDALSGAGGVECFQPLEAHSVVGLGDCGGSDLGLFVERIHVFDVAGSGVRAGEMGLRAHVRFIEAQ